MRVKFLRTKYFTGSRMQKKYLALLLVSMLVPIILVSGCLYYLIFNIMAEQIGIPEYIAYNLLPVVKKINFVLLVGVPPILLVLIMWGVVLSHKFIGPIERVKNEVDKITESGDYKRRIKLRKNDDIIPVADAINRLLDKVEGIQ